MIEIRLNDSRWLKTRNGHVLGSAFLNEKLLDANSIDDCLHTVQEADLPEKLRQLNGRWTVCLHLVSGKFLIATDRTRTWPLYYTQSENNIFISDDAEEVRLVAGDTEPDPVACEEFLHVSCVTGRDTLYPHVKQMLSGEILLLNDKEGGCELINKRWYVFKPQEPESPSTLEEYLEQLDQLMLKAHQRLIDYADGRPIYIPLSGGVDSRSVATTLARLKYDNLHAYSYGDPTANDPIISKEVAEKLHIPWQHIPYSKKMWRKEFQKAYFQKYLRKYFQYAVVPNIQELPAAHYLKESGSLPADAVIAPGECDLYMGSNALSQHQKLCNLNNLYKTVIAKNYNMTVSPLSSSVDWHQRIAKVLGDPEEIHTITEANSLFEQWIIQEITNKFYIYAMSAHVFFGTDIYYPLCDNILLDFWEKVPHELRFNRNLQINYVGRQYAMAIGKDPSCPLKTDRDRSPAKEQKIVLAQYRKYIPNVLKYMKRHIILARDKWGWHYAFPFRFRHNIIKEGSLSIDFFYGKYLLEEFVKISGK